MTQEALQPTSPDFTLARNPGAAPGNGFTYTRNVGQDAGAGDAPGFSTAAPVGSQVAAATLEQSRLVGDDFLGDVFWDDDSAAVFGKTSTESDQSFGRVYFDHAADVFAIESTKTGAGVAKDMVFRTGDPLAETLRLTASGRARGNVFTVTAQSSIPSAEAGRGQVYAMTVFGTTQLFYRADDGTVSQITPAGVSTGWQQGGNAFGAVGILGTNDAFDLSIRAGGVEAIRVDDVTRNVGVGAAPTGAKLFVAGSNATNYSLHVQQTNPGVNENAVLFENVDPANAGIVVSSLSGNFSAVSVVGYNAQRNDSTVGHSVAYAFFLKDAGGTFRRYAAIHGVITDNTGGASEGALAFVTETAGTPTEKARITAAGALLVGATTPVGAERLRIVGDARVEGKFTVTGALDPTSVLLSGGTALFYESLDGSTAPVAGAATGRIRYLNASGAWQLSVQGGAYINAARGSGTLNTISKFVLASGQIGDSYIADDAGSGSVVPTSDGNRPLGTPALRFNSVKVSDHYRVYQAMNDANPIVGLDGNGLAFGPGGATPPTKVVGAQGLAVASAAGGATVDAEARTAVNTLLARLRASTGHGLIAG